MECVKCIQVQVSDQECNVADWYTDYLLHAACVTLASCEFTINQQEFEPTANLCIVDMTFMDTSEGIKAEQTIEIWNQYTVVQIKHHFKIMSFHFTDAAKCLHRCITY